MSSKLMSLKTIFNSKLFRVPDYQRGYSWGHKQLEDFWRDLSILRDGQIHYAGMLSVDKISPAYMSKNNKNWSEDKWLIDIGYNIYHVVDGQQRLATIIILINEILNAFEGDVLLYSNKKEWRDMFLYRVKAPALVSFIFGYESDDPSFEFFKTNILGEHSFSSYSIANHTLYTANLAVAKSFFADKISNLTPDMAENIFNKLLTNLKFNYYEIDSELDVFVTFETMNNRGKPLTSLELLKNRFIYLSSLVDDQEQKVSIRNKINLSFKTTYEYLGKNAERVLEDENFLRNFCLMYFGPEIEGEGSFSSYLLEKHYTRENFSKKTISVEDLLKFAQTIQQASVKWYYLHNPDTSVYDEETKEWIRKIGRLGTSSFHPLLLSSFLVCTADQLPSILKAVERFIFLVYGLSMRRSNTGVTKYNSRAKDLFTGSLTLYKIVNEMMFDIDGENENGYQGWFNLLKFKDTIFEYFEKDYYCGYYSWKHLRYFLYEYELHLQGENTEKVKWSQVKQRELQETVEHIYPETPTDNYWIKRFEGYSRPQIKNLTHGLGNLLLLSRKKNSSLQNWSFSHKKYYIDSKGRNRGYESGSYTEIEVSQNKNWTPKNIAKRGETLLEFMESRWGFSIDSWDMNKKELLGLDFL